MKKLKNKVVFLSAGLLLVGSNFFAFLSPALAEWLWNDPKYLKGKFETFLRNQIKKKCDNYSFRNLAFGYQIAFSPDEKMIAYSSVVRGTTLACWERLQRTIEQEIDEGKLAIGSKKPEKVSFFPDVIRGENGIADGGPTILFYFPASKAEIDSLKR